MDGARTGLGSRGLGVNRDYSHRYVRREEWSDSGAGVFSARPIDLHCVGGHTSCRARAGKTQNTPLVSRRGSPRIVYADNLLLWHDLSAGCARAFYCSRHRLQRSSRQIADTHCPPLTDHARRDPPMTGEEDGLARSGFGVRTCHTVAITRHSRENGNLRAPHRITAWIPDRGRG